MGGIHAELARKNLGLGDDKTRRGPRGSVGAYVSSDCDTHEESDIRPLWPNPKIKTIEAIFSGSVDRCNIEDWFRKQSGYLSLEDQENIDGMFIKFVTSHAAQRALNNFKKTGDPEVKVA